MLPEIKTITLALPYHLGSVNCYLIKLDIGYILIDTGSSNQRHKIEEELHNAGCRPGDLKLIVLTHGDFDHTGNAAYLRQRFGASIAMHADDAAMLEQGDMFLNRKSPNRLVRQLVPILFRFGQSERCKPDLLVEAGYDLSGYGYDAKILLIPGHSQGSIGILTTNGDLFVGDLLENTKQPAFNSIMDDLAAARASVEKLKGLKVKTIYPGHGQPFSLDSYLENDRRV